MGTDQSRYCDLKTVTFYAEYCQDQSYNTQVVDAVQQSPPPLQKKKIPPLIGSTYDVVYFILSLNKEVSPAQQLKLLNHNN